MEELLGLKWSDVDWANNQIQIQRTYNHGQFFSPKSASSNRRIDLGPKVISELKKWKLACPPNSLDLVFPSSFGNPMDCRNMVKRYFESTLEKAKIPKIRFHDLRHTFASMLIEQGENIKYIQKQLGHSKPSVTMDIYAHLFNDENPKAASRLEERIFQNGSKTVADKKKEVRV